MLWRCAQKDADGFLAGGVPTDHVLCRGFDDGPGRHVNEPTTERRCGKRALSPPCRNREVLVAVSRRRPWRQPFPDLASGDFSKKHCRDETLIVKPEGHVLGRRRCLPLGTRANPDNHDGKKREPSHVAATALRAARFACRSASLAGPRGA